LFERVGAGVVALAEGALFEGDGGVALLDGLEGEVAVSAEGFFVAGVLGAGEGDVHAGGVALEADDDGEGDFWVSVVGDEEVAGDVGVLFGGEGEGDFAEGGVAGVGEDLEVEGAGLGEVADEFAEFFGELGSPGGEIYAGFEAEFAGGFLQQRLMSYVG
jgi:hypothetical protein